MNRAPAPRYGDQKSRRHDAQRQHAAVAARINEALTVPSKVELREMLADAMANTARQTELHGNSGTMTDDCSPHPLP